MQSRKIVGSVGVLFIVIGGMLFVQPSQLPIIHKIQALPTLIKSQEVASPSATPPTASPSVSIKNPEKAFVKRVIDGDTIELSSGQKVRYIGIDTPETVDPRKPVQCFGKEASAQNKQLVEGKEVTLKKDVSETDKYGRVLRYVWIKSATDASEIFVNDFLVRQGFARVATFPPDVAYVKQFIAAQEEARQNGRGLWSLCQK